MATRITELPNISVISDDTIIPLAANVANVWDTYGSRADSLKSYMIDATVSDLGNLTLTVNNQGNLITNNASSITSLQGNVATLEALDIVVTSDFAALGYALIPATDLTHDLGSATKRWRDLYIGGSTIYLGNTTTISANSMSSLQGNVTTLQGNVTTIESDVSTAQTDISTAQSAIGNLQTTTTSLQADIIANKANVTILQGNVITIGNEISALEGNVAGLQSLSGQIITNANNIGNISNVAAGSAANISSLQQAQYTTVAGFVNETPASASAVGTQGQISYDASYVYICVAANTWIRTDRVAW